MRAVSRKRAAPDDLDFIIAKFRSQHPWVWRRTQLRDWFDRQIGRWLPFLCRCRTSVGPVDGPHSCLDCGKRVAS